MIKTALKHWIYDYCIGLVFDSINRNFSGDNKIDINNIKIGDQFSSVRFYIDSIKTIVTHYHCIIVSKGLYPNIIFVKYYSTISEYGGERELKIDNFETKGVLFIEQIINIEK